MTLEQNLLKRCKIEPSRLEPAGFVKRNQEYYRISTMMNGAFQVEITVSEKLEVTSKIIDLALQEEYINHRIEHQSGEFVSQVRAELTAILQDFKKNCTTPLLFQLDQANRIATEIFNLYQDEPAFPWAKHEGYGVFKNPTNQKWYALIMNINMKKLNEEDRETEILNLKLAPQQIQELLGQAGFYPSYHMNKKNWITLVLDNTLEDEKILALIQESHRFTEK